MNSYILAALSAGATLLFAACADESGEILGAADPAGEQRVGPGAAVGDVPLLSSVKVSTASGVYVGGRTVLTNWHVCTDSMSLVIHQDPGGGAAPYREGAACRARGSCNPPASIRFEVGPSLGAALAGEAVFMSRAIDVCIVELNASAAIPPAAQPVDIDTGPVRIGQEVVVASYPGGATRRVVERCRVTQGVAAVRDPDRVNPSDLVVQSVALDCKSVQHGSSGAPVFDAQTGALLGLVWTGVCLPSDRQACRGPIYMTTASAWRAQHASRPASQYARLSALLRERADEEPLE